MIVVDTSVWVDYVQGVDAPHTCLLDFELENSRIITGDLIIIEFLQGFRREKDYQAAKSIIDKLEHRNFLEKDIPAKTIRNSRKLQKHGVTPRKTINVIIATFCIENDYELLHNDRDFDPMERFLKLKVR